MTRWLLALLLASCAFTAPLDDCRAAARHGKTQAAAACYTRLTRDRSAFLRAEGFWGLRQFDTANTEFRAAIREQPQSPQVRAEWGHLFSERFQPDDAGKLFNEALQLDPNYAPAFLGLARLASEGYSKQASELANEALKRDSRSFEAHELLSYLALEDNNPKLAGEEAGKALAISSEAIDALAVLASIDWLAGKSDPEPMRRALAVNPVFGEGFETGAHFLVINRRYDEGIALYRKALELSPELWSARSQLGLNLLRFGRTTEAKAELTRCYEAHYRDKPTINALRFLDRIGDFETVRSSSVEVVLNKNEAALLRPYVQAELERAIATYSRKYRMQLPGPVRLELYPNHDDFVVRTLGLPGQGGLLGVTFGLVVAMDSPSARAPGEFRWASTLWHELSHVFVVTATHHLVPRWFTEGLAVHEEGAISKTWGDRMTPQMIEAIKGKKLLPVADIDRGFIRPDYPTQVLVSYFQAGKMLDFIASKWGDTAILGMIQSFGARKTTTEAVTDNLHLAPAEFDKQFLTWLNAQTATPVGRFDEWRASMKDAHAAFTNGNFAEAIRKATVARSAFPEYVGGGSAYEVAADAHSALNQPAAAADVLEHYRDTGGSNVDALKKLAGFETDANRRDQALRTLQELSYIYPQDEELHRRWGNLLLETKDSPAAIREYQALLALKPGDPVEAHYRLASAFHQAGRNAEAKDEVLVALEDAPRYRPAQKLLLELSDAPAAVRPPRRAP